MVTRIAWFGKAAPIDETDARIARLTDLAVEAFGNRHKALRWLQRPRREFGGISPLEMMETAAGARQVESLLIQLASER